MRFRCRGRFDRRDPSRVAPPHPVPLLFLTLYQLHFPKLHISPSHRFPADTEVCTERLGRGQRRPGFKLTALDEFAYLSHHLRLERLLSVALESNRKFYHTASFRTVRLLMVGGLCELIAIQSMRRGPRRGGFYLSIYRRTKDRSSHGVPGVERAPIRSVAPTSARSCGAPDRASRLPRTLAGRLAAQML